MKSRIILALLLSVFLIGGATWIRYSNAKSISRESSDLISTSSSNSTYSTTSQDPYDEMFEYLNSSGSAKPLTKTETIGRQLILDYVDLATNEGATDESIDALANKYVEDLPSLHEFEKFTLSDLNRVPDSQQAFMEYGEIISAIHTKYAQTIKKADDAKSDPLGFSDESMYSMAATIGKAYETAALELSGMNVPESLTSLHLELLNSYRSSSVAMSSIATTSEDSAKAFIGLIVLSQNFDREDTLLIAISNMLSKNGV